MFIIVKKTDTNLVGHNTYVLKQKLLEAGVMRFTQIRVQVLLSEYKKH